MRSNDVYILAVTRNNANAMLTFQFMSNVRLSLLGHGHCQLSTAYHSLIL